MHNLSIELTCPAGRVMQLMSNVEPHHDGIGMQTIVDEIQGAGKRLGLAPDELVLLATADGNRATERLCIGSLAPKIGDGGGRLFASLAYHCLSRQATDGASCQASSQMRRSQRWFIAEDDQLPQYPVFETSAEVAARVIGECYGFEYYLVAKDLSWLICETHHNVVCAVGAAVEGKLLEHAVQPFAAADGFAAELKLGFTKPTMKRLLCVRCGDSIHPDTANRNAGLCMPCTRGNQLTIEQRNENHRKQREEERAHLESPQYKYWGSLISRVYSDQGGFGSLQHGDQLYFLINVLTGEVHNGGFDQFFSNSSGDLYAETVEALSEVGDQATLQLLLEAKAALFAQDEVPANRVARFDLMATSSREHPRYESALKTLDELDKRFYASSSNVDVALDRVVKTYNLYGDA